MSYDPDALLDRRRLKIRLRFWQAVTLLVVLGAVLALLQAQGNLLRGERIVRVHIEGVIVHDEARNRALMRLAEDDDVRAVIIHIDSPGGSVVGGEDLYNKLRAVSEAKPVATVMGTVATSAAYMTAIAADKVFARAGSITGSIGVILQSANVSELLKTVGIEPIIVKSSELKGVPSPVEPLTLAGRAATESIVLDLYDFFVGLVIERRPMNVDVVRDLADGRVFSGRQAVENGLIDAIGDEASAIDWMVRERELPAGLPVETLHTPYDDDGLLKKISHLARKSLFSNALTLDGLVSLWQPAAH
ncbi:MAG: signal peptide peptidase SppA [Alphaproteobacteria bacterium]|nr:signal peptide peptidase SppA [Alphaproteobacteria bacterium]